MSFVIYKHHICTVEKMLISRVECILFSTIDCDFEILSVGIQDDNIVMWAKEYKHMNLGTGLDMESLEQFNIKMTEIFVYPTGDYYNDTGLTFIGTVISKDGFVFHVFRGRTF